MGVALGCEGAMRLQWSEPFLIDAMAEVMVGQNMKASALTVEYMPWWDV